MAKKATLTEYSYYNWVCPGCGKSNEIECRRLLDDEVECEHCEESYSYDIEE